MQLLDVNVQVLPRAMLDIGRHAETSKNGSYTLLKIEKQERNLKHGQRHIGNVDDIFVVCSKTGTHIAILNFRACAGLSALRALKDVEFEAMVDTCNWRNGMQSRKSRAPPPVFTIEVNIYGYLSDLKVAGSILSSSGLFLQRPLFFNNICEYQNPQCLFFEDMDGLAEDDVTDLAISSDDDMVRNSTNVASILDSLPKHEYLRERDVDNRVVTPLLRYG